MKLPRLQKNSTPRVPASAKPEIVQAAEAIATAINQGLKGEMFARIMFAMDRRPVELAASKEMPELVEAFKEDEAARAIFESTPTFPAFVEAMHAEARKLCPRPV